MKQTLIVETAPGPDVLARVTMLLARGNLSIAGMDAERQDARFHLRLTLVAEREQQVERFIRQAEKLVDVYAVAPPTEKSVRMKAAK
ncbi:ACT domain-containing protein [Sporolactobacillus sp. Y61]|uniref:ACT domain-containing protein n=1 Tax=Sporolactobacillus sp. Y61 TaxID=3160863 RepID=A0AAU8IJL3_9BACL|nr:ACT domain-containing protein [Sporolactobacillus sp. THM19-2]RYL87269.1 hypothetical protein EWH91_13175 [Sporolactobacillus sp. THM19-2]